VGEDRQGVPAAGAVASGAADVLPEYTEPISVARAGVRRRLGDSELRVHPAALSTKVFGWTVDRQSAMSIMDRFHLLGGNFLDTDSRYGGGHSQVMVGAWLASRHARDRVVLAARVGRDPDRPGLQRKRMLANVEAALQRLRTDHLDLLTFADDETVPLEDSLATAHELIEAGKVRCIAAVGYAPERLAQARVLAAYGMPRFTAVQAPYSLMNRSEYEGDVALVAAAQGLGVLPLYPLAHGFLTGQYRHRSDGVGSARRERAGQYLGRHGFRVVAAVERVAQAHGVPAASIALAWLLTKPGVVAPVASAEELSHVDAMMGAADIRLSRAQLAELDRASA